MSQTQADIPPHVQETIHSISKLHAEHRRSATRLQRAADRLTRFFGQPRFVAILSLALLAWLVASFVAAVAGRLAFDAWLIQGLQSAASVVALYMTVFILMAQRHEDELAELRGQLTLEMAIISEQKTAKVIELLEELRRDLPAVRNRGDPEAEALAEPADREAVAAALRDIQSEARNPDDAEPSAVG